MTDISPHDVFKTQGQPTVTYIERDNGKYEKQLSNAIDSKGIICVLTGPSKTGKTTLYSQVVASKGLEPLVIRCHNDITSQEVWRIALENVNFERIREISKSNETDKKLEGKVGGKIGWSWLAGLVGEVTTGLSKKEGEVKIREKILANPQPTHLIPILKNTPYFLILEDFHYLNQEVQKTVFQQWKAFIDSEVSVVVVGTTHHASDLAYSNKDLIGRYTQIDLGSWETIDLKKIPQKGFTYLKRDVSDTVINLIAKESVGLPIISQCASLQLILNEPQDISDRIYTNNCGREALHDVANTRFGSFSSIHDRLIRGPRSKRKYNTYELVFATFADDPLKFSLTRQEIDERLCRLAKGVDKSKIPPQGSVTSMLNAIGAFQKRLDIELLEWSDRDQKLFILEPTFLFYLRWKEKREPTSKHISQMVLVVDRIVSNFRVYFSNSIKSILDDFGPHIPPDK